MHFSPTRTHTFTHTLSLSLSSDEKETFTLFERGIFCSKISCAFKRMCCIHYYTLCSLTTIHCDKQPSFFSLSRQHWPWYWILTVNEKLFIAVIFLVVVFCYGILCGMWLYVSVCVFCVTFTLSIQLVNDKHLDYILVHVCVCVTENLHHSLVSVLPSKSISRYGYKLLFLYSSSHFLSFAWEIVCKWVCVCNLNKANYHLTIVYTLAYTGVCVCMMHTNMHFILFASWHFSLSPILLRSILPCIRNHLKMCKNNHQVLQHQNVN